MATLAGGSSSDSTVEKSSDKFSAGSRIQFLTAIVGLLTAVVSLFLAFKSNQTAEHSNQQAKTVQSQLSRTNDRVATLQSQLARVSGSAQSLSSVQLPALCPGHNGLASCGANLGIAQIGSTAYNYTAIGYATTDPTAQQPLLSFTSTTCQTLTLTFGFNSSQDANVPSLTITVTVSQPTGGQKQVTVSRDEIGTLKAVLNKQPWIVSATSNVPPQGGNAGWFFYMDGSASCSSTTGS
jgi:hypothetical protein